MRRVELMSLAQWQQLRAEPICGRIYQQLRILYYPQVLSERLDNLILLKQRCEEAIKKCPYNGDYHLNPIQELLRQTQLLIEYILNADNAEHAKRLLGEREFYRPYYPHYVTAPPAASAMARALIKSSENRNPEEPAAQKRKRFLWRNCIEQLLDLQTGKVRQVNHDEQDNDLTKRVGRYSAQDRETYRILPAKRHQGYVHLVVSGDNNNKQLIIQDFYTREAARSQKLNDWILVITPEGDQFAIQQFRDADNKHAASSLHFGRSVLFAGLIVAQGQIKSLIGNDPHYETEMINTHAVCQYFITLGILTAEQAKRIRQNNFKAFLARIPIELHPLERELLALYGIESTRRSFFNDTPAFEIIWHRAQASDFNDSKLIQRTVSFISAQQERFQDTLPLDLLKLRIGYSRHLKALERIENDPFIANKENAMNAYETKVAAKIFDWACQKTNEELEKLKLMLITILSGIITQHSLQNLAEYLTQYLQFIANITMEMNTATTQENKQSQISKFVSEREKLFQDLRSQPQLKKEHHSLLEHTQTQFALL